jgi:uncharacterized protein (DUF488 family)
MLYTIGHSTHAIDAFIALLKQHDVQVLADVRSVPMSRFNPQFRQRELKKSLEGAGLAYVYLGDRLGGQSSSQRDRATRVPYEERILMPEFQSGMAALLKLAGEKRTAIMCAEKEPLNCHRTLLIARALAAKNFPVTHILGNGDLRPHAEVENELMGWQGLTEQGLFDTRETQLNEAYEKRRSVGTYKPKRA